MRLEGARLKLTELAQLTGDEYKNVQRWMSGSTETIPADFVGRYIKAVPVSPLWILTGEGSAEPVITGTAEMLYDLAETVVAVRKAGLPPGDLQSLLEEVTGILKDVLGESGAGGGEGL